MIEPIQAIIYTNLATAAFLVEDSDKMVDSILILAPRSLLIAINNIHYS